MSTPDQKHPRVYGRLPSSRPLRRSAKWLVLGSRVLSRRAHHRWRRVAGDRPRALLVVQNDLMFQYVSIAGEMLDELGVRVHYWGRQRPSADRRGRRWPWMGASAPYRDWDLVVLADHAPLEFPAETPTLLLSHGLVRSGKAPRGSYFYDREKVLRRGRVVYRAVCDASERSVREGLALIPELAGRVHAIGDCRVDEMVRLASNGSAGGSDPPRVVSMSTWGAGSLYETDGGWLLPALGAAHRDGLLRVTVASHPNLWRARTSSRSWPALLADVEQTYGVTVLRPDDPWEPALASADAAISDHTSLLATYAVLGRPILSTAAVGSRSAEVGTITHRLLSEATTIDGPDDVAEAVRRALSAASSDRGVGRSHDIVDNVGGARQRLREVIGDVLEPAMVAR